MTLDNGRPAGPRERGWVKQLAERLAAAGVEPYLVSAASVAFAALGAALMLGSGLSSPAALRGALLIGAGVAIELRLLCRRLAGMVAVEHGRGSPTGPIWNELPDRISDVLLLAGAGYAAATEGMLLAAGVGWLCAVLALLAAYVRELGRGLGFVADVSGPFAGGRRMQVLAIACTVGAFEPLWGWRGQMLMIGLITVGVGTALTAARRTRTLARQLAERAGTG